MGTHYIRVTWNYISLKLFLLYISILLVGLLEFGGGRFHGFGVLWVGFLGFEVGFKVFWV